MNNCAVCGIEITDHSGMLCDDCAEYADQEAKEITEDAAHDQIAAAYRRILLERKQ